MRPGPEAHRHTGPLGGALCSSVALSESQSWGVYVPTWEPGKGWVRQWPQSYTPAGGWLDFQYLELIQQVNPGEQMSPTGPWGGGVEVGALPGCVWGVGGITQAFCMVGAILGITCVPREITR